MSARTLVRLVLCTLSLLTAPLAVKAQQPGGNVTGLSTLAAELEGKRLGLFMLKTARALGLTMPPTLLFQADEVIK